MSPYGTGVTKALAIADSDASHPAATRVEAKFTFVDDNRQAGTLIGAADVGKVDVPAPVIAVFSTDKTGVEPGSSATLQWTVTNGASASIDNGVGAVSPTSGSITVTPAAPTTYTLTAVNPSGSVTRTVSIAVGWLPTVVRFTAEKWSPSRWGGRATLKWTISNAVSATIDNGIGAIDPAHGSFEVPSGTLAGAYTLTAVNSTGSITSRLSIGIADVEYTSFRSDPGGRRGGFAFFEYWYEQLDGKAFCDHYCDDFPLGYQLWGAPPGMPLSMGVTVDGPTTECATIQIYKRGALYKQAESCGNVSGARIEGTF